MKADAIVACRHFPLSGGSAGLRQSDGDGEPENRRLSAEGPKAEIEKDIRDIQVMFPILKERGAVPGDRLSGGEQMMLVIGRALMSRPKLLLLDEPSLGPRATTRRADLRHPGAHPRRRRDRPPRRTERRHGARYRRPCLRAGGRFGRPVRHRQANLRRTSRFSAPISGAAL